MTPVKKAKANCGQYPNPAPAGKQPPLYCERNTTLGRYVIIQQPVGGVGSLTICELEVYAHYTGWFGGNKSEVHKLLVYIVHHVN